MNLSRVLMVTLFVVGLLGLDRFSANPDNDWSFIEQPADCAVPDRARKDVFPKCGLRLLYQERTFQYAG
jgi:hypothetical protein